MVGSTCLGQQQRRQDQRQHQQAGVGASRDFLHIMNGKKSKQQADKIAAGSRQQARNCNNSLKQRIAPLGSNEPPGQTLHAQPKFKSLRAMSGEYEVNILGAFWGRAAQHSRTCPVAPRGAGSATALGGSGTMTMTIYSSSIHTRVQRRERENLLVCVYGYKYIPACF